MDVTAKLAQFAVNTRYDALPAQAIKTAKVAIRDCLGVALAGSKEEDAKIAAHVAREEQAKEETTVIGNNFKSSALNAALANGTAAHAMDYDHSFTLMGQPTAPIIPATFALGEALGASGRQIIEAYAIGYEVTAKLVHSLRDSTHEGWHGPSSLGAFGAAASCAKLLGLDEARTQMALGITASLASGVVANFGTMTKPLHVGHGARNGVLAAKLAQAGFTANNAAIEHAVGYYNVHHGGTPVNEAAIGELGRSWALLSDGLRIKPYPCGGLTHQVIDSILEFRGKHNLTPDVVESVKVDVVKHTFDRIAFRVPQNGIQGKFCMPYLVARALIDGKVSLHAFTDQAVRDPKILAFAEKVEMNLDTALKKTDAGGRPCRVTVQLKNGQTYTREAQHAKGSPEFPMSEEELRGKFTECARETVSDATAQQLLDNIARLETLASVKPVCEMLRT
ncbi:MAG: MmgE/PrpD family protein [Deltaproteobacteria bacterium]|nr:MmgE/PrpD family protein [Deltaproteobacteria bacterium]